MAYFALRYSLADDYMTRRTEYRSEHLGLARAAEARGELLMAGAFADPPDGALYIFRGVDASAATEFAKGDPYVRNGLVKHWDVRPWTVVIGAVE